MTSLRPSHISEATLAVETLGLTKKYGKVTALDGVNLRVPRGAVYLLLGANGAGKSTTLKILLDQLRPSDGEAKVFGMRPQEAPALVRANIGYVPERLEWGFGWMRVGDLLAYHAAYYPSWDAKYATKLCGAFALQHDRVMSTLSKGQGRRVHLAMALAHRPPLLVLDEPTDGLDPVMRHDTLEVLNEHLVDTATTVLLCTHHVGEVERIADHIGVMRAGTLSLQTSLSSMSDNLRRYRAVIPRGWHGEMMTVGTVVRQVATSDEVDLIVWGEPAEITAALETTGATVQEVSALPFEQAILALLSSKGGK